MKHLDELTRNCCRWIDEPPSLLFCGEPVVPTTSWCMMHLKQVFQPTPRRHPRLPIRLPVETIPTDAPPDLAVEPPAPELQEVMPPED